MEINQENDQNLKIRYRINRFFYFIDQSFIKSLISYLISILLFRFFSLLVWNFLFTGISDIVFESMNIVIPHLMVIGGTYLSLIFVYLILGKFMLLKNLYMVLNTLANFSYIVFTIYYDIEDGLITRLFSLLNGLYYSSVLIPVFTFVFLINYLKKIHRLKFKALIEYPSLIHGLEINFLKKHYHKKTIKDSRNSKRRQLEEKFKSEFDALSKNR